MIPKNLFFIWYGMTVPDYVNFAISAFKDKNPDFNIKIFMLNDKNLLLNEDPCVLKTFSYVQNVLSSDDTKCKYYNYLKLVTCAEKINIRRNFATYFSDILRQELVETYGGIYCDCDTYPIKAFDENLLAKKHFNAICKPYREFFFFGAEAGINSWFQSYNFDNHKYLQQFDYSHNIYKQHWDKFNDLNLQFKNCKLNKTQHCFDNLHYIDHYYTREWKNPNNKNNLSKYDIVFNTVYA